MLEFPFKYYAFISYKREDEKWAKWLQNKLETYKLPTSLAKETGKEFPKTFHPCFRDKTDLSETGDLTMILHDKLQQSQYLIVICSPRSAKSEWVNKEVETFKEMGRADKIIPIIIEGNPDTSNPNIHCYPTALDENILGISIPELGKKKAVVKAVAAMLNINFDTLWNRYRERILKRRINFSILIFAVMLLFGGIFVYQNIQTKKQRDKALVSQSLFLADLSRQQLEQGDAMLAMMLALKALPKDINNLDRPFIIDAEKALRDVFVYLGCNTLKSIFTLKNGNHTNCLFSPDGKKIIMYENLNVLIVDALNGNFFNILSGHTGEITSLDLSSDGKFILTTSIDSTARIWNLETGKNVKCLKHKKELYNGKFSYNGKKIFTWAKDGWETCVWNIETQKKIWSNFVEAREFSTDDSKILAVSTEKGYYEISIWDIETNRISSFEGNEELFFACLTLDGNKIIICPIEYNNNSIKVLDAKTGKEISIFKGNTKHVHSITLSPDKKTMATIGWENIVRIWDIETGKELIECKGHTDYIESAFFSSDGKKLLTSSRDATARIWDVETGNEISVCYGHTDWITSAIFNSDNSKILTISYDGTVRIWDRGYIGNEIDVSFDHRERVMSATFSPDEKKLLVELENDNNAKLYAYIWDIKTRKGIPIKIPKDDDMHGYSFDIEFSPDSKKILLLIKRVFGRESSVQILDVQNGEEYLYITGNFISAVFNSDSKKILTREFSKDSIKKDFHKVWNIQTGENLLCLKSHDWNTHSSFSPDGKSVLLESLNSTLHKWDITTKTEVTFEEQVYGWRTVFSPDGKKFSTVTPDNKIIIWDATTGKKDAVCSGNSYDIFSIVFSPDNRMILTNSYEKTNTLWDVETGRKIKIFHRGNYKIKKSCFSPDGNKILISFDDKTILIWDVKTKEEIAKFNGINNAIFTPDSKKIIDNKNQIWDIKTQKIIMSFSIPIKNVDMEIVSFNKNMDKILTKSWMNSNTVQLWDFSPLQELINKSRAILNGREFTEDEQKQFFLE